MRPLPGLSAIADAYDGYILDLWGVVHDGVQPFAGALDCLSRLRGRPVLLLSNAPRRALAVQHSLQRLGVANTLYSHILTSGEAAWQALHDRRDAWFQALGRRVFHLGPRRDRSVFEGLAMTQVMTPADADLILNTGPDDTRETETLAHFIPDLTACLGVGLKMICANPDLEIVRGDRRILCAGALAAWYEAKGGDVRWIGKPDPAIYRSALAMLGLPADRVLAIGDSLRTDIAGAAGAGLDSLWVLGGLHAAELGHDPHAAERAAVVAGLHPVATIDKLVW
jgi:HAD superfamily hydrolase (TIGR01459 family)